MHIALRFVAAPLLAASAAVTIAAATASAVAEQQPARATDKSMASPDNRGIYCGQFCGTYSAYGNNPGAAVAPASYGVGEPWRDQLSPVSIRLPLVDAAGVPVPQH